MEYLLFLTLFHVVFALTTSGQSARSPKYSESAAKTARPAADEKSTDVPGSDDKDVIRVETDLVTVPVRVTDRSGRAIADLKQNEFRVFENGVEQEVAYFSAQDRPFAVALVLDMSYSSVFKLQDIQNAAKAFVGQLSANDKVMVVSFDERVRVLCEPTNNRKVLHLAIEGARIASGTSLYDALDQVLNEKFRDLPGRKAIVLLSDGVDTMSRGSTAKDIRKALFEEDVLVYPIRYDTFDDVRKTRRDSAPIQYDDNDRPYIVERPPGKGERESDYEEAREFLTEIADMSGGRLYKASSNANLNDAFARIAEELRKTYSLGYYPKEERRPGVEYTLKVRIYRPNLTVRTREIYLGQSK